MPLIFHQNMHVYGGGSPVRNVAFNNAFALINWALPAAHPCAVAGFTEVMNAGVVLRGALSGLALTIDPLLTRFVVIEVGITAVGTQREFIGIAWDPLVINVQHVGQVLWDPTTFTWKGHDTLPALIVNDTRHLPRGVSLGADSRGLAYIAGLIGGNPVVFAFMHNMFNLGNRSGAFSSLGVMCDRMIIGMQDPIYTRLNTMFYLGGDFNIMPRNPTGRGGIPLLYKATRAIFPALPVTYVNTTNANPYDFWVVNDPMRTDADARVWAQTRTANCSDHAGITLKF